jgi:hypothetical protein
MTPLRADKYDRVFVKDGRRHYRRAYSVKEVRVGAIVLAFLAALVVWVVWRGANPDPELFASQADLLVGAAPAEAVERDPLPEGLAAEGWTEASVSRFDPTNLYVKINGREDYYKTFGFQELIFLSLFHESDATRAVDIEFFDLGEAANALGAYAGERAPEAVPEITDGGMTHFDRNALFLTRGRYYIRAIGSEESPTVRAQLERLRAKFEEALAGEALPWAYALFAGELGMDPGRVAYEAENAFGFGFASNVYSAVLDDDETEVFVVAGADEASAAALAERFTAGFLQLGERVSPEEEIHWIKDRYLGAISAATTRGSWTIGVRGAPDVATAQQALETVAAAVERVPQGTLIEQGSQTDTGEPVY